LVDLASRIGLDAIAITDHDTFAGYEKALPIARDAKLDLVRGIELNSRLVLPEDEGHRYVHLLAYFVAGDPSAEFRRWLQEAQEDRRDRNRRLVESLNARGIDITLEEVEARGKTLAARPHFARILVEKGYAENIQDAFDRFLGESAPTYVERESESTEDTIAIVRAGGGVPVVAHPVRLSLASDLERRMLMQWKEAGLLGLEVFHSEHSPKLQAYYRQLAEELELLPTGGSDFHGAVKPNVNLGTGAHSNIRVPRAFLDRMRKQVS
jgi:predicted metal-dependent phosphoesterase TrpH